MKKGDFIGEPFSLALEEMRLRHNRLAFTVPSSGSCISGEEPVRAPDLILYNQRTRKRWIVEFKVSGPLDLSPSVLPQLLSYRRIFGDTPNTEIVLLTNSPVPEFVLEELRNLHVMVITDNDPKELLKKLEEIIRREED